MKAGGRGIDFLLPSTLESVRGFTRCLKVETWGVPSGEALWMKLCIAVHLR